MADRSGSGRFVRLPRMSPGSCMRGSLAAPARLRGADGPGFLRGVRHLFRLATDRAAMAAGLDRLPRCNLREPRTDGAPRRDDSAAALAPGTDALRRLGP